MKRNVAARCTLPDGSYIEVGKEIDTDEAYIARYRSGIPFDYLTIGSEYTLTGVSTYGDIRSYQESYKEDSEEFDISIYSTYAVGTISENGVLRPVVLSFDSEFESYHEEVLPTDYFGRLNDCLIIEDKGVTIVEGDVNYSLYCCGLINTPSTNSVIIKIPLYMDTSSPVADDYPPEIEILVHANPSEFRKLVLDSRKDVVCVGANLDNPLSDDFDFLVKYYPGSSNPVDKHHFCLTTDYYYIPR